MALTILYSYNCIKRIYWNGNYIRFIDEHLAKQQGKKLFDYGCILKLLDIMASIGTKE